MIAMFLWKSDNYYISECVFVASVIHNAMPMRRIIAPSVVPLANHILPHYLTNGAIFGQILLKIKYIF
jgi:hypothetical protein